jgi:hypothetical protein
MPDEITPTAAASRQPSTRTAFADYPRPDLEPQTDEERVERKNPLGYSVTEPTEAEIEAAPVQPVGSPKRAAASDRS